MEQMPKSDDCQNKAKRDQRHANTQSKYYHCSGNKFNEGNYNTGRPERPDRQKSIGKRQEILASVIEWPELKHLHYPGHEENESEYQTRKQNRPRSIDAGGCCHVTLNHKPLLCSRLSLVTS